MKLLYTNESAMFLTENGKEIELPSYRAIQYQQTIAQIQEGKVWKTTGRGAQFMGIAPENPSQTTKPQIQGLALYQDDFLYTLQLDASGGIYRRTFSEKPEMEGHICSGNSLWLHELASHGDALAATLAAPNATSHLVLFQLPSSAYTQITDGDSCESHPSWSPDGRLLYFSTAGIARNERKLIYSPRSAATYNVNTERMEMILEDEKHDILAPKVDASGNLYFIRQPYRAADESDNTSLLSVLKDVLLFPYRLIKAFVGFLNVFSIIYGNEPLQSSGQRRDVKSKEKSEKELFFEGRMIDLEKNRKENVKSGDKYAGIMSRSRVLVRRAPDGTEEVLAKAVLDYTLCDDGSVVYSNGAHILHRHTDGTVEELVKTRLARNLVVVQ
jgi:hypothetical protein